MKKIEIGVASLYERVGTLFSCGKMDKKKIQERLSLLDHINDARFERIAILRKINMAYDTEIASAKVRLQVLDQHHIKSSVGKTSEKKSVKNSDCSVLEEMFSEMNEALTDDVADTDAMCTSELSELLNRLLESNKKLENGAAYVVDEIRINAAKNQKMFKIEGGV